MSKVFQHTLKTKKGALDELAMVYETSLQPTWRRVWCTLAQYQDDPSWAQLVLFKLLMEMQISTAWFSFRRPKEPKEKQFKWNKIFPSLSKLNLGQTQVMPVWVFYTKHTINSFFSTDNFNRLAKPNPCRYAWTCASLYQFRLLRSDLNVKL